MRPPTILLGAVLLSGVPPAYSVPLRLGIGASYLYPAGRLGDGLTGGTMVELSLAAPAHRRIDLGVSFGYATLRGRENDYYRVVLSPLELILRARLMELTESSSVLLDAGLGVIGMQRTLNSGKEGALLGGEGVACLGLGVSLPFGNQAIRLGVVYHALLDPLETGHLFSLGGLAVYQIGM